jgi:hypothetical protein
MNPIEGKPEQNPPRDVTTEFLSQSHSQFADSLIEIIKINKDVAIEVPFSKAPNAGELGHLLRLFENVGGHFLKITIHATKEEHDAHPELFEIKAVKWEEVK